MPGKRERGLTALLLAALTSVGAAGALASSVPANGWAADPEEQYLLDVKVRQLRLGDGVRAYPTPEGACIVFGDIKQALGLAVELDLDANTLKGWAFHEDNKIFVDRARGSVTYQGKARQLAQTAIRDTPEGWCVDSGALTKWLGITLDPKMSGSALIIESEAKLPVEMAVERERRAAHLKKKASIQRDKLPHVRLPYRMWRAPALDFVVSGGVTYRASTGTEVDRRMAVYAAGEVARLSYTAQMSTDDEGIPRYLRLRAYRSDADGGLLGPLDATHFEFGDVSGRNSRLLGSGAAGRGAYVTNRPLFTPAAFDRTRFEGDLPAGWDAELYRNGQLLAFARSGEDQRYVFDDVQLLYGDNRIEIVLYGPQGQIRTRSETVNVGQDNVPPGKTWYWAGINQPGRDLLDFRRNPDQPNQPKIQGSVAVAHGIDQKTSVSMAVQMVQLEDERLTYVEGAVRRSIGGALVEIGAARDDKGGTAARAQLLTRIGDVSLTAEMLAANDFRIGGRERETLREARLSVDAPVKIGRKLFPVHADVRYLDRKDGGSQLEAAARLSTNIDRFNLATDLRYKKHWNSATSGPDPPDEVDASLIASGRIGRVRVRGSGTFDVVPEGRFRSAEVSAYWAASDDADFEAAVAYDAPGKLVRGRLTHVRRFQTMALALTGEAASDGSVALGFNLNFSLDSGRGFKLSRRPLASAGAIDALVYRDLNDNGRRDAGEPLEEGAFVTTGSRLAEQTTDVNGRVMIAGLNPNMPVAVGIDTTSLANPMLAPKKALQLVTPRRGVAAPVEIGLVGAGDIEGVIAKGDGQGFEGLDLELVDPSGNVVATTRTDFDGFFLFERVAYGEYRVRVARESAQIARISVEIGVRALVSDEQPMARTGVTRVSPLPIIAKAGAPESPETTLR